MPIAHAAIIGAGTAGLTAALALARRGISSDIFEQASVLAEVGAGLQISPNASRILSKLGVLENIEKVWLEPQFIRLFSGVTLQLLAAVPAGDFARIRWGAPYGVLHRATLQGALLAAVAAEPLCAIHLGRKITPGALPQTTRQPDVTIGADGVWSKLRQSINGGPSPHFSGYIAYRFTIAGKYAPAFLDHANVSAFLGPSAHLVCYPLKEADSLNLVAITAGNAAPQEWGNEPTDQQLRQLISRFSGWSADIKSLIGEARITFWPLYEATEGKWQNGSDTVLIGDAAHAMTPFAAQGAAMAIEDAYELAALLAAHPVKEALLHFEQQRAPRVARIRKRGAFNRLAYHARGPVRIGRDIVLSLKAPQRLASDLDWIYGYRPID
ncbi:salicylate hydroxylase protein [Rhizobium etli 8C-3]|uniref:Salicylate hydroxylase n=2 Tax=Rhizobium TaxID=379 RepID=A0A4R3QGA0_9HYPH|nr:MULTISPECIES: FAD-dependent monooxygenase [Rhizobium]APO74691.1 salicylate hydroxylase protein [Rhizobium etli 8C-3]TCU20758.1 salicylate hydroxylase [Rhizobium azibense]TCU35135.1 salicylate hydroxylase [Rhizobium azibense]